MEMDSFNQFIVQDMHKGYFGMEIISIIGIFGYKIIMKNTSKVKSNMRILCNAGTVTVNQIGGL